MKNLFLFPFLFVFFISNANNEINEIEKDKQICLVWGLMKYHHPDISRGKYDWDKELIQLLEDSEKVNTKQDLNNLLLNFINKFEKGISKCKSQKINLNPENVFLKNVDFSWINQNNFDENLFKKLSVISNNRNVGNHYASSDRLSKMISFKDKKRFPEFNSNIKNHRLLLLFIFWNTIEYWDVNKYLMDEKWSESLNRHLKNFIEADSQDKFEKAKLNLIASLNDSHSHSISSYFGDKIFNHYPIFIGKIINDSLVVTGIYNKKLADKDSISLGDVIYKIEGKTIKNYISENFTSIISASNENYLYNRVQYSLIPSGNKDTVSIESISKEKKRIKKQISLYPKITTENPVFIRKPINDNLQFLRPDIAYLNLNAINQKELKDAFKKIKTTKGLIIDLRNYPKNYFDIAKYLCPKRSKFIKILYPLKSHPAYGENNGIAPLSFISDPFKCGTNNKDYYRGKVVLLVNRSTMSKAEFIGMQIQNAPDCITIGEQTAGSVMNIQSFTLPDKQEVYFTGLGAFYPNGENVQRKGLRIDHKVNESALNFNPNLYIEEAIKIIDQK